jgi:A/G-specific adenine glycosylase
MSKAVINAPSFAERLVAWQKQHGRHDLPWQSSADPYRVWLSEIMLQQTQVVTVMAYYDKFLKRFPTVSVLASASLEEVLGLWSGLGYYSRAKNLHLCAQMVASEHGGVFPNNKEGLQQLPGIGPSTAAAIASLCFGKREAILDGNVKRVLTRVHGFGHDLSHSTHEKALWKIAQQVLPASESDMPTYTQGMMDLGATLCTRTKPACARCPMQDMCVAHQEGLASHYPVKTRKVKRSAQAMWLLFARSSEGAVWLQQRPPKGVWASLFTFPIFDNEESLLASLSKPLQNKLQFAPSFVHVLTHKDLHLHVAHLALPAAKNLGETGQWWSAQDWPNLGLPAPVRQLLHA